MARAKRTKAKTPAGSQSRRGSLTKESQQAISAADKNSTASQSARRVVQIAVSPARAGANAHDAGWRLFALASDASVWVHYDDDGWHALDRLPQGEKDRA